jgi:hypothetical protein
MPVVNSRSPTLYRTRVFAAYDVLVRRLLSRLVLFSVTDSVTTPGTTGHPLLAIA